MIKWFKIIIQWDSIIYLDNLSYNFKLFNKGESKFYFQQIIIKVIDYYLQINSDLYSACCR